MSYTPISKMTDDLNVISGLPNRPSDGGYNATTLKAAFDEAANAIKDYINGRTVDNQYVDGLVDELNAKLSGIEEDVSDFLDLQLPQGAVKTDMIDNLQVTSAKLSQDAVTTDKILNGAVTTDKLGPGAVTTAKLGSLAVDTGNIAAGAVTFEKTYGIQKVIRPFGPITIATTDWEPNVSLNCLVSYKSRVDDLQSLHPNNVIVANYEDGSSAAVASYNAIVTQKVHLAQISSTQYVFLADNQPGVPIKVYLQVLYY